MKVYAYMERGSEKQVSEDTMLVNGLLIKEGFFSFDATGEIIAIADGVGGNAGGQYASEYVINRCKTGISDDPKTTVLRINDDLIRYARTISGMEKMATTLSAIVFCPPNPIKIIHVGNTRVSAIQGEYIKQLTKDNTTVEFLKARGDYDAAGEAPQNEITSCMGAGIASMISQLQIIESEKEYAGFVLTSDGFHDYIDVEDIEDFIAYADFSEQAFRQLAQKAKANGSDDDKSIIIIRAGE